MLAAFFYQGDVPEPSTLLDMARECLVAESNGDLDSDVCKALVSGLCKAWCAAREHAGSDDHDEPRFETAANAETAYMRVANRHHDARVRLDYPEYQPHEEGSLWWPDGLASESGWPVAFINGLAATLGEIEGENTIACARYFEAQQQKAAGGAS